MKKKALSLLFVSLCLCSCGDKETKLSFKKAKEFIISHPLDTFDVTYTDQLTGEKRNASLISFKSLGTSGTIKLLENYRYNCFFAEVYAVTTIYFDYSKNLVLSKIESSSCDVYRYRHILNETECESKDIQVNPDGSLIMISGGMGKGNTAKELANYGVGVNDYVDAVLNSFGPNKYVNGKVFHFSLNQCYQFSEEEFSESVSSYSFYLKDDCLNAYQTEKIIVDEQGYIIKGSEGAKDNDSIVELICEYTTNSKGLITQGKLYGTLNNHEHIMSQLETSPLDESYNKDLAYFYSLLEFK